MLSAAIPPLLLEFIKKKLKGKKFKGRKRRFLAARAVCSTHATAARVSQKNEVGKLRAREFVAARVFAACTPLLVEILKSQLPAHTHTNTNTPKQTHTCTHTHTHNTHTLSRIFTCRHFSHLHHYYLQIKKPPYISSTHTHT